MTDYQLKRLDENWGALPQSLQDLFGKIYSCEVEYAELLLRNPNNKPNDFAKGRISMLESLFGKHNLTAQAEEKPKEPKFKVGDKVSYFGQVATIFKAHCNGYDVIFGNGATLYNLPEDIFAPYTEPNGESKPKPTENSISEDKIASETANSVQKGQIDYAQYRLDLAKEIAVAMVKSTQSCYPNEVVALANEIVKRLKETEI